MRSLKDRERFAVRVEQGFAIIGGPCKREEVGRSLLEWSQIWDVRSESNGRRGKSERQRAASPLTAGRLMRFQISDLKFGIGVEFHRTTTSATENRPAGGLDLRFQI